MYGALGIMIIDIDLSIVLQFIQAHNIPSDAKIWLWVHKFLWLTVIHKIMQSHEVVTVIYQMQGCSVFSSAKMVDLCLITGVVKLFIQVMIPVITVSWCIILPRYLSNKGFYLNNYKFKTINIVIKNKFNFI